jgi:hypothetical protein
MRFAPKGTKRGRIVRVRRDTRFAARSSSTRRTRSTAAPTRRVRSLAQSIVRPIDPPGRRPLQAQKGFLPPAWVYPYALGDARNVIKGEPFERGPDSTLLADFKAKLAALKLAPEESARLVRTAERALVDSVRPAYLDVTAALSAQAGKAPTEERRLAFRRRRRVLCGPPPEIHDHAPIPGADSRARSGRGQAHSRRDR